MSRRRLTARAGRTRFTPLAPTGRCSLKARAVALVLLGLIVLVAIVLPPAKAQQAGKVYRIGFLALGLRPAPGSDPNFDAFLQGLRDLGYVEGRNVVLEVRYAEGRNERFPALTAELVNLKIDVLVAQSTPAAIAAEQASSTVPIVMVVVGDPLGAKLIDSVAHPGGNVSGLSLLAPELSAKRLDLFKQALPKLSRVTVLWNSAK